MGITLNVNNFKFVAKKVGKRDFLAKIAANVPFGFDPKRRRGSIIRNGTSRKDLNIDAGDEEIPELTTLQSVEIKKNGQRHRESKELIVDFDPHLIADRRTAEKEEDEIAFNLPNIPEIGSNLRFYCLIF